MAFSYERGTPVGLPGSEELCLSRGMSTSGGMARMSVSGGMARVIVSGGMARVIVSGGMTCRMCVTS